MRGTLARLMVQRGTLLFGLFALVACWGSAAVAQTMPAEPSTGTLIGYGVMAAVAITPTIGMLLKLGRDVGRYEADLRHQGGELLKVSAALGQNEDRRRGDLATILADNRNHADLMAKNLQELRREFQEAINRTSELVSSTTREDVILRVQAMTTKLEADILKGVLKEIQRAPTHRE